VEEGLKGRGRGPERLPVEAPGEDVGHAVIRGAPELKRTGAGGFQSHAAIALLQAQDAKTSPKTESRMRLSGHDLGEVSVYKFICRFPYDLICRCPVRADM
jgi:hypothetical protein